MTDEAKYKSLPMEVAKKHNWRKNRTSEAVWMKGVGSGLWNVETGNRNVTLENSSIPITRETYQFIINRDSVNILWEW